VKVTDAKLMFERINLGPYSLDVGTGEKIVIVGPNGGGKSSFIKLIAGEYKPSSGSIEVSTGINIGYIDQDFSFMFQDKTVLENIKPESEINTSEYYNLLAKFGVKKGKADSLPAELSPGQRARALLAELVAKGTNLILMDEPTNHLDISASDELQNALKDFNGTLIVVTHDRELINSLEDKKIIVIDKGQILAGQEESNYLKQSNII
jgi:ATPase subunit of ABC transporter with duplicated ATPase domains